MWSKYASSLLLNARQWSKDAMLFFAGEVSDSFHRSIVLPNWPIKFYSKPETLKKKIIFNSHYKKTKRNPKLTININLFSQTFWINRFSYFLLFFMKVQKWSCHYLHFMMWGTDPQRKLWRGVGQHIINCNSLLWNLKWTVLQGGFNISSQNFPSFWTAFI